MRKLLFTFVILLSTQINIFGQDSLNLDQVIVTASRIPMETYKTGRSITVIDSKALQDMPVSTVDEMLRYVAGINLNARNGFGVQSDIGMRGSTFSQVLVLVDNVRLNDPLTAHFNNNIPVALAEIDQIEIVRGPAAAAYGADAVGGVIYIKTKTFTGANPKNKVATIGDISIGEHNLNRLDAGVFYNKNNWDFSASYKSNIADGEEHVNPNFPAVSSADSLYQNYFDLRTVSAAVAGKISDEIRIYGRVGYDYRDFKAKYFYTRSAFDESAETVKGLWSQLAFNYKKGAHGIDLNGGYKKSEDLFVFNPLFPPNSHEMKQYFANLTHNFAINEKINLASGVQFIQKDIESTDRGNHDNQTLGIYSMLSYALTADLQANVSLRAENDTNFGWEILPQASLSYRQNDMVLRASYGRSVRAADFTERFISYQIPSLSPGRNAGNPDLKAESSHSFDLGGEWYLPQGGLLSLTGFYRTSSNLIDYSLTNANDITNLTNLQPGEDYFYANNISESDVVGLEFQVQKPFVFTEKTRLSTQLSYTWLKTSADVGELSKYISNHPKHQLGLLLNLSTGKIRLTSASSLSVRQDELAESINGTIKENYFTTNLKLGYQIAPQLMPYIEVQNLTDTKYQEILGANLPGRWWSMGVRFER